MKDEYIKLIAALDVVLSETRNFWTTAKDSADVTKHRNKLNELLDERFRLMTARDAH